MSTLMPLRRWESRRHSLVETTSQTEILTDRETDRHTDRQRAREIDWVGRNNQQAIEQTDRQTVR